MTAQEQLKSETEQLEALIAKVENCEGGELVIEHLQTASAYLQGAMPEECAHNLNMARRASHALTDGKLKSEVEHAAAEILETLHPLVRRHWSHHLKKPDMAAAGAPPNAKGLDAFFHGHDVKFGVFYPTKHVVAVFPSFPEAQAASAALLTAGFKTWEVIAVPGPEVRRFLRELQQHHTLWSALMMEFSRILDTEANLVDDYARWARLGAGFLIASSPTQEDAEAMFELLKPFKPGAVHWFMPGYIRHMM